MNVPIPVPVEEARAVRCPVCRSGSGLLCTQPTNTGQRAVSWVHLAREDAAMKARTVASDNA